MVNTGYTIRPAKAADAEAISALWRRMAEEHRAYDPDFWCWSDDAGAKWKEHFIKCLKDENMITLVSEGPGGELVGFVNASCKLSPPIFLARRKGEVWDLYVTPDCRGNGLGTELMEGVFERFKGREVENVVLHVAMANPPAKRFYEKLGMRAVMYRMYRRL